MQSLSLPGYPLHFDYRKIFCFCVNIDLTFYFQSYYYTLSLTGYSTLTCSAFSVFGSIPLSNSIAIFTKFN